MCNEIVIWAPDNVLYEYGMYFIKRNPEKEKNLKDFEIHFGKSILAYRREFKHKNKNIRPEMITAIFKSGWDKREL